MSPIVGELVTRSRPFRFIFCPIEGVKTVLNCPVNLRENLTRCGMIETQEKYHEEKQTTGSIECPR
jgi:hypothetical protein